MWLSLNIISKMVDISDISAEELAQTLTISTAEIEGVEHHNKHLETIITAKILSVRPHPDADKLTLVDLDTGKEKLRVVCGAPNHKEGDIVPLATIGTVFNGEFEIKKSKIRGEESNGMLCSNRELGFSEEHSGILIFPQDTEIGIPLSKLYPDWVDTCLEIDNKSITHRPDLWSHRGFAREIGALLNRPVTEVVDTSIESTFKDETKITVTITNPEASPRYSILVVKNITIQDSPEWLKAAVTSIGMRPINNIVDITNYVMAELGEPMHAFDQHKLAGNEIIVRMAQDKEKLMVLDGDKLELCTEDIVIADKSGPIALAGVMGGGNSEIDMNTKDIILEAANFNPVTIRKTAHRYNKRTEAAIRFEKSLSPYVTNEALFRCYQLIKMVNPDAYAASQLLDGFPVKPEPITIETSCDFIRKRLGQDIENDRIISILKSLEFTIKEKNGALSIIVPPYRATKDISIPEDIVEEVGRIYGYDNIVPLPPYVPCGTPKVNYFRRFERKIKQSLTCDQNMIEISGYSFVGEELLNKLGINEDKELRLRNPLSQEQDRLRRSLIPNIIKAIEYNQRYNDTFKIYEMNRTYLKNDRSSPELTKENNRVAGAVYQKLAENPLFYDAKSVVAQLLSKLRIKKSRVVPKTTDLPPYAHPGRSAAIMSGKDEIGLLFELHPKVKETFEINGDAALFDIDLNRLFDAPGTEALFTELQKFPAVPFELSVIAESHTYTDEICSIIRSANQKYIKSVDVISIYEGDPIQEGKKSVSLKAVFYDNTRTLPHEEIEEMQNAVVTALRKKGFNLR